MWTRLLSFLLLQAALGVLAWWQTPLETRAWWTLGAMLLGACTWWALDAWRGLRLLHWLKNADAGDTPVQGGLWGEVHERMRRLLRQRERVAMEAESRLQDFLAAMQASPNGVTLLDAQGRIEWFNQTAAQHFGLDPQRDLLQHLSNLVRDPLFVAYFNARNFSKSVEMAGREDSPQRPVRVSVHVHPYGQGRNLVLSRDITALEQAEAMRRDFVANVSHEIRTPLTVLSGFVETLQTLPLDAPSQSRYLGLMAQQAERMQTLVNDLLMLSRLEGSPPPPSGAWVALEPLLQQCVQDVTELSHSLWGQAHALQLQATSGLEVDGAINELQSAFVNLMGNAVRYSPVQAAVHIECVLQADGALEFSVRDHGVGIAPEHIPRLTERFYRVDRSRSRESGGTGLGLAIVKHVAQRHGAELKIESVLGQGSRFSLLFPAARVRTSTLAETAQF